MSDTPSSITLEMLELFVAVVDAGTISDAARTRNLHPSIASRRIGALETALGGRLFERTTRRVHLTEAGAATLEWAKAVLQGHIGLAEELTSLHGSPGGLLRVVMNEYLGAVLLPPFLAEFTQRYPRIRFAFRMTDAVVHPDERGYDVAVHSGRVPDSSLIGVRVLDVHRILCASPSYLARRGTPSALEELSGHDCLSHQQNAGSVWYFRCGDEIHRQPIQQTLLADGYMALIEFARQGLGIIRVSDAAVRPDIASGALVQVLPEYESVYPDGEKPAIWMLYPPGSRLARARLFFNEFKDYLCSRLA